MLEYANELRQSALFNNSAAIVDLPGESSRLLSRSRSPGSSSSLASRLSYRSRATTSVYEWPTIQPIRVCIIYRPEKNAFPRRFCSTGAYRASNRRTMLHRRSNRNRSCARDLINVRFANSFQRSRPSTEFQIGTKYVRSMQVRLFENEVRPFVRIRERCTILENKCNFGYWKNVVVVATNKLLARIAKGPDRWLKYFSLLFFLFIFKLFF